MALVSYDHKRSTCNSCTLACFDCFGCMFHIILPVLVCQKTMGGCIAAPGCSLGDANGCKLLLQCPQLHVVHSSFAAFIELTHASEHSKMSSSTDSAAISAQATCLGLLALNSSPASLQQHNTAGASAADTKPIQQQLLGVIFMLVVGVEVHCML